VPECGGNCWAQIVLQARIGPASVGYWGRLFRPSGAGYLPPLLTHGLRRGLHSCAAPRLLPGGGRVLAKYSWKLPQTPQAAQGR
jgi:hypothetical protein